MDLIVFLKDYKEDTIILPDYVGHDAISDALNTKYGEDGWVAWERL